MKTTFEDFKEMISHLDYEIEIVWKNSDYIWSATLTTKAIEFAGLKSQVYSNVLMKYLAKYELAIEIRNTDKECIRIHSTGQEYSKID